MNERDNGVHSRLLDLSFYTVTENGCHHLYFGPHALHQILRRQQMDVYLVNLLQGCSKQYSTENILLMAEGKIKYTRGSLPAHGKYSIEM